MKKLPTFKSLIISSAQSTNALIMDVRTKKIPKCFFWKLQIFAELYNHYWQWNKHGDEVQYKIREKEQKTRDALRSKPEKRKKVSLKKKKRKVTVQRRKLVSKVGRRARLVRRKQTRNSPREKAEIEFGAKVQVIADRYAKTAAAETPRETPRDALGGALAPELALSAEGAEGAEDGGSPSAVAAIAAQAATEAPGGVGAVGAKRSRGGDDEAGGALGAAVGLLCRRRKRRK